MSLSLLASNYEDGIAIIREPESGGTFVVRPPFDLASRIAIDSGDVEEAVTKHGFAAENASFPNYASLIEHLETRLSESRKEAGIQVPEEPPLVEALKLAPTEIILGFLNRIERELIPQKNGITPKKC